MNPSETFTSEFSQKRFPIQEKVRLNNLHAGFIKFVQKTYPQFSISGVLAFAELNKIRLNYIKSLISKDSIEIHPASLIGGTFHTYEDHRLATAAAMIGLRVPHVLVENIETTSKTFPDFPGLWSSMLKQIQVQR